MPLETKHSAFFFLLHKTYAHSRITQKHENVCFNKSYSYIIQAQKTRTVNVLPSISFALSLTPCVWSGAGGLYLCSYDLSLQLASVFARILWSILPASTVRCINWSVILWNRLRSWWCARIIATLLCVCVRVTAGAPKTHMLLLTMHVANGLQR